MCLQSFRIPTEIFFSILPWTSMTTHVILFCIMGVWASRSALKPLTVWIPANWKILKEMGVPDHVTCFLRNLCAGKEAIVRTRYGTTDWFKIGKGVHQSCILSPCLCAKLLQSCLTFCIPMDLSPPGTSVHGIFRERLLEWVAMLPSRVSFWHRDQIHVSYIYCIGRFFTTSATWEAHHPTYLTYKMSTACEMPCWMNQKLE